MDIIGSPYLSTRRYVHLKLWSWLKICALTALCTIFVMQEIARHTATETARLALEALAREKQTKMNAQVRYHQDMAALIAVFQGVAREFATTGSWAKEQAVQYLTILGKGATCDHQKR
jgi:hypothetical protein